MTNPNLQLLTDLSHFTNWLYYFTD